MADGSTGGSDKPTRRQLARLKKAGALDSAPRTPSGSPQLFDIYDPADLEDRPDGCHSASSDVGFVSSAAEPLKFGQVAHAQELADSRTHSGVNAPLVSGSAAMAGLATEYISVAQLHQALLQVPRFVPMAVQLPQAQEHLSADPSELRSELEAEHDMAALHISEHELLEHAHVELQAQLAKRTEDCAAETLASRARTDEIGILRSELSEARDKHSVELSNLRSELATELRLATAGRAADAELDHAHKELHSLRGDLQRSQIRCNLSELNAEEVARTSSHEQAECTLLRLKLEYEAALHTAARDDLEATQQRLEISVARTALVEHQAAVYKQELAQ